jgi:DNA-binding MarR family transcriptional regulator
MNLYSDKFYTVTAPPAIEINVRPNILYTEEYSYLTKDELEVLFLLATTEMHTQGSTLFSFSGIKRRLGKHQQKITKAINRLVTKGLVKKENIGYSISPKGTTILSQVIQLQNAVDLHHGSEKVLEQYIIFNKKIAIDEIADLFIGKWFGPFRYVSHTKGEQLVINWQLVDSKTTATLQISNNKAVLHIIPNNGDNQQVDHEQVLEELCQFLVSSLKNFNIDASIEYEQWKTNPSTEIDYQAKLSSWLKSSSQNIIEN